MMHNEYSFRKHEPEESTKRTGKDIFIDVLYAINLILVGAVAGIALCKFWPEFWHFVNWGMSA